MGYSSAQHALSITDSGQARRPLSTADWPRLVEKHVLEAQRQSHRAYFFLTLFV